MLNLLQVDDIALDCKVMDLRHQIQIDDTALDCKVMDLRHQIQVDGITLDCRARKFHLPDARDNQEFVTDRRICQAL